MLARRTSRSVLAVLALVAGGLAGCGSGGAGESPPNGAVLDISHQLGVGYTFGRGSDEIRRYQTFVADDHANVVGVAVKIRKWNGNAYENVSVELYDTDANQPSTQLASSSIDTRSLRTSFEVLTAPLTYQGLVAGHTYAIVLGQQSGPSFNASGYEWSVKAVSDTGSFGKWTGTAWQDESGYGDGWLKVSVERQARGAWATRKDMPTRRSYLAAAVLGGKIWAVGGQPYGADVTAKTEAYDPSGNSWSTGADLPVARAELAAATLESKLYAIGGLAPVTDQVKVFDGTSWTAGANLLHATSGATAVTVNGKIYLVGGQEGRIQVFDPVAGWSDETEFPSERWAPAVAAVGTSIYIVGGNDNADKALSIVEVYDTTTKTWGTTPPAAMPTPRTSAAAVALDGKIYVVGGNLTQTSYTGAVEVYDPATDTWAVAPDAPTARAAMAAAAMGGKIYVVGGYNNVDHQLSKVEAFTP